MAWGEGDGVETPDVDLVAEDREALAKALRACETNEDRKNVFVTKCKIVY